MRLKHLSVSLLVLLAALFFAHGAALAQSVTGYTSIDYDDSSGIVTAYSETSVDYDVMWDYNAYVALSVTDTYGSLVVSGSATDFNDVGFISITLQFYGQSEATYTAKGTHRARAVYFYTDYIEEYYYPYRYRPIYYYFDYWYFGFYEGYGIYEPWYYYFLSPGYREMTRPLRLINLGTTTDYAVLQVRAPHPTNFRRTAQSSFSNGQLHFEYAWDSSTGNVGDLGQCTVGEIVYQPTRGTYVWPKPPFDSSDPSPGVIDVAATLGRFNDDHLPPRNGYVAPFRAAKFTATQIYRYKCNNINGGRYVNLTRTIPIVREFYQNSNGSWTYKCSKSGFSATSTIGG
ncbi:MAG TPA: hypothetical protein VJS44_06000 [Pyrinomonadaceae bacterium]|nr:hypothetical protein [Pyrinomonadaceae bacterium]